MPLLLKSPAPRKPAPKLVAKKQATPEPSAPRRPFYHRFNMVMPKAEREELHAVADEYGKELNVKLSAAFIVRMALDEALPRMRADLNKAKNGRYHAKIRKEYSLV